MAEAAVRPELRAPEYGEPAPFFVGATETVPNYSFGVAAGRWIVLMVFGTLSLEASRQAHALAMKRVGLFNNADAAFFGVTVDRADMGERGLASRAAGVRYFLDYDYAISRLYGLSDGRFLRPAVFLIDRMMRIVAAEPIEATGAVLEQLERELKAEQARADGFAPVLAVPRVFEPEFCDRLIAHFEGEGGRPSGFAADVDGRTVDVLNPDLKRRTDVFIEDEALRGEMRERLERRLLPMVKRAFNWGGREIERYLVSRYAADDQGFFCAHRDDVTAGTAHRKFAVSIGLNDDYEGGELRFPEFGARLYRPEPGGAIVFCCSLLHEVRPVTRGLRYVVVPFLYDEDGARIRRASLALVGQPGGNRKQRRADRGRR